MRRGYLLTGSIAASLLLAGCLVFTGLLPAQRGPFNKGVFGEIRPGMTEREVCAVLRAPPGDYHTVSRIIVDPRPHVMEYALAEQLGERIELWEDDEGIISVWFDRTGKVNQTQYEHLGLGASPPPLLLDRLRAWLGW